MFPSLDRWKKWAILSVLALLLTGVSLRVYKAVVLKKASEAMELANKYRDEAVELRRQAEALRGLSAKAQSDLDKANKKISKLQTQLNGIVVPPKPDALPATVAETMSDLRKMGLELPAPPSLRTSNSISGFTVDDAGKVWYWGKEAIRVPSLELKIEKLTEITKALEKGKDSAEELANFRTREADKWHEVADKKEEEAVALRDTVKETQKALKAEQKRKYLYAIGAGVLGYVVAKK